MTDNTIHAENVKSVAKLSKIQGRLEQAAILNPEFKSFVDNTLREIGE